MHNRSSRSSLRGLVTAIMRVAQTSGTSGSAYRKKWVTSAIFKKYLQCVLAANILTVDFVMCTLAVKKKSGQVSTCRIGPFLVSSHRWILRIARFWTLSIVRFSNIGPWTMSKTPAILSVIHHRQKHLESLDSFRTSCYLSRTKQHLPVA
jgi:hypothetical protein